MIRVAALAKRYAGAAVLEGVDLEVAAGTVGAVLGGSGAGKTTLLRCLVGLESFDSGTISVDGITARADSSSQLRGRVGLVFQTLELFPHLTVLDNCTLAPRRVRGVARGAAEQAARALLDGLGLGDKADAFPDYLSGGQRQRVAIARALAMEPRALLYDEPTSALDPSLRREVVDTLRRVRTRGVTQLIVTHDVGLARELADALFILDGGRVVESGPPERVLGSPQAGATRRLLASG